MSLTLLLVVADTKAGTKARMEPSTRIHDRGSGKSTSADDTCVMRLLLITLVGLVAAAALFFLPAVVAMAYGWVVREGWSDPVVAAFVLGGT